MSLLTSSLYDAIKSELDVGEDISSSNASCTFYALSIANGTDRDDEDKINDAVDAITAQLETDLGVDLTVEIDWLNCIVSFRVVYEAPPPE